MTLEASHPRDELQALLDGRLPEDARARVERHLDGCSWCRGELEALIRMKEQIAVVPGPEPPPGLRSRVLEALDAEDARARQGSRIAIPLWLPVAAAAGLVALLLLVPVWFGAGLDLPDEVRAAVGAVADETLPLEARDMAPAELEAWFATQGLGFPARVFDFGAMSLQLVGGRVHEVARERAALYTYRLPDGTLVICQMYPGAIPQPDPQMEVHYREDGVEFRTLRRDGATLVFWQEGEVACVLASEGLAPEEVRALAFAKALAV